MRYTNSVAPKAAAELELLFNELASSLLKSTSMCVKFIAIVLINLLTPKAAVKLELFFDKLASASNESIQQQLILSCSFRCDQSRNNRCCEFGHTLMRLLSLT